MKTTPKSYRFHLVAKATGHAGAFYAQTVMEAVKAAAIAWGVAPESIICDAW